MSKRTYEDLVEGFEKATNLLDVLVAQNHSCFTLTEYKDNLPNGSFDYGGRQRFIFNSNIARVTNYNQKRTMRDFAEFLGENIFVKKGNLKDFTDAFIEKFFPKYKKTNFNKNEKAKKEILKALIDYYIDLKMFGMTLTVTGLNGQYTGPIQVYDSESLNDVYTNEDDASITTCLVEKKSSGSKRNKEGSGVGKSYKIRYALMSGFSEIRPQLSEFYNLTYRDIKKFDMFNALAPSHCISHSKGNRRTRLYLRFESKTKLFAMEDIGKTMKFIPLVEPRLVSTINDYEIDVTETVKTLNKVKEHITAVYLYEKTDVGNGIKYFVNKKDENGNIEKSETMPFSQILKKYISDMKVVEINPYAEIEEGYYTNNS